MTANQLRDVLGVFDLNAKVSVVDYDTGKTIGTVVKVGVLDNIIYIKDDE